MEQSTNEKTVSIKSNTAPLSILSNGIVLDAKTAANLQVDTIKSYIRQSRAEGSNDKTMYLKHLLTNKINVPSNEMLSKAGKFYNYRSYGYETIYQQNKIKIADAIGMFQKEKRHEGQNGNKEEENENDSHSDTFEKKDQQKTKFQSYSPNDGRDDNLFDKNQSHKVLNTTCLQFKKEKQIKINQIIQKKQMNPDNKPSSAFVCQERDKSNSIYNRNGQRYFERSYSPVYNLVLPSSNPHQFLPLPSSQRREDVVVQPDCIIRGNLCEFKVRNVTQEMRSLSDKIMALLKKLEELESKAEQMKEKSLKDEPVKLKDMLDIIQDKKKQIGEEILELQKLFIKSRSEYEELISKNLSEQEYINYNNNPDKIRSHETNFNFKKLTARGLLFPEQNVKDIGERQFNNYRDFKIMDQGDFLFKKNIGRGRLFDVKDTPAMYDHFKQYENTQEKTNFHLVNMSKESKKVNYYTKHDFHAQKTGKQTEQTIEWNRIVEGEKRLSNYFKPPQYTNIKAQMTRDKPHPHQIRTIKVNANFYTANSDASTSPAIRTDFLTAKSQSPLTRKQFNYPNSASLTQIISPF